VRGLHARGDLFALSGVLVVVVIVVADADRVVNAAGDGDDILEHDVQNLQPLVVARAGAHVQLRSVKRAQRCVDLLLVQPHRVQHLIELILLLLDCAR
jgi:hypothetical protein